MAYQTAAGASLSAVASLPATYDDTGYGALTAVIIGEITNIGEFGKEFALVTHQPLATRGTKKGKGSFNNGQLSPALALDNEDAGQIILTAALEVDTPISFCVTLQDGTEYWFGGLVMAFKPSVGGVDDIVNKSLMVEIDDNPIVVIDPA